MTNTEKLLKSTFVLVLNLPIEKSCLEPILSFWGAKRPEALSWAEAKELSNWKNLFGEKEEILRWRSEWQNKKLRMTSFLSPFFTCHPFSCHTFFTCSFFNQSPFFTCHLFLLVTLRRSRRVSYGDSSPSLTRKRMRFFTPLTLRSEWQKKMLRRCPEPKPWAYAKGLRRNDKIVQNIIFYRQF